MYFRTATRKRNGKQYSSLHLVESYRTKQGKVRQRILINFGPVNRFTKEQIQQIICGLEQFFGIKRNRGPQLPLEAKSSRDLGGSWAIFQMWDQLGWTEVLERHLRARRYGFDVVGNLKVLVANRLLDPMAKLHIVDWVEGVHFPGVRRDELTYNHLLRAMDFLIENKEALEVELSRGLLGLFDQKLELVFYDLTSCYFEVDGEDRHNADERSTLRNFGYDRDRSGCPQVVLGLVMTQGGLPVCHYVFPGHSPDESTLEGVVGDLKGRFPIGRCVVVAHRGLLSEGNLRVLSEHELDYIVARPLRRSRLSRRVLEELSPRLNQIRRQWKERGLPLEERHCVLDVVVDGRRFVLSHSEVITHQSKSHRTALLRGATQYIQWKVARAQRGAMGHQSALLHIHDYLNKRALRRYYRIWLDEKGRIQWQPHKENRLWENLIDGKLLLETTNKQLPAEQVLHQYKELQDIERAFRTLKSSLDIRPVYHWVDRRIRAHIFLCVMALQIERLIRGRFRKHGVCVSALRALEKLSLQRVIEVPTEAGVVHGMVTPTPEQLSLFDAMEVNAPQHNDIQPNPM